MLELVDLGQKLRRRFRKNSILEGVDAIVEGLEQRKQRVDELIDHEIGEETRVALGELWVELDSGGELDKDVGRVVVDRDEVILGHEHVVLAKLDVAFRCKGPGEDHDEGVAVVLLQLGPLVLVLDVLDRQVMKSEDLFPGA